MNNTLPKSESLKSKKLIRLLFSNGKSEFVYPFKIVYCPTHIKQNHQALLLISVGKKKIKTAVERNHIKRLFREAYRKNKHSLIATLKSENKQIALGFIYVGKPKPNYDHIEEKLKQAIEVICSKISTV